MTTIANTFRTLVLMTVSGAAMALSAGCAADATGGESVTQTTEALPAQGGPIVKTITTYTCGAPTALNRNDPFERALSDMGCSSKESYAKNGVGTWFQATCPMYSNATFPCPLMDTIYGTPGHTLTANSGSMLWCYSGVAPYSPSVLSVDKCTGQQADGAYLVLGWDPNCSGASCPKKVVITID